MAMGYMDSQDTTPHTLHSIMHLTISDENPDLQKILRRCGVIFVVLGVLGSNLMQVTQS